MSNDEDKKPSSDKSFTRKANASEPRLIKGSHAPDSDQYNDSLSDIASKISSAGFDKKANVESFTSSSFGNTSKVPLLFVDPMFDPILLMFPKENIRELYRRLRHYYTYDPIVGSLIDLHSEFPISDFDIRCSDSTIEKEYGYISEKLNLPNLMVEMGRDRNLLGESLHVGNWDPYKLDWSSFNQYPPENIDIHKVYVGPGLAYFLKPDDELKKLANSPKEVDRAIFKMLPKDFAAHIINGKPYQLDNQRVIHFARKPSGYTLRGESLLKRNLKDLLYKDKLRLLQLTFVDRHMFPIKHWKIGSKDKGWIPSRKHFQAIEDAITASMNDPDFNLITHPFVEAEFYGSKDKIENLIPHFDWVNKQIMIGLFASEAMVAGEANPYANQAVSMKLVMHRYMSYRATLQKLVMNKIFLPIAIARKYIKKSQAEVAHKVYVSKKEPEYILPEFFWRRLNLLNSTAEQEFIMRLREKGEIPFNILEDMFNISHDSILSGFTEEESTSTDPLWRDIRKKKAENDQVANQILEGVKTRELIIPAPLSDEKPGEPKKSVGRPKSTETAPMTLSHRAVPPRDKATEKGTVPKPLGETEKKEGPSGPTPLTPTTL